MDLRPRVVSVGMNVELGTPIDYGWKRLLACGFFSTILVLDPSSARSIQSLQGHRHAISSVAWAPENHFADRKNPYILRLASADVSGIIIVWDIVGSSIVSEFGEPGYNVLEIQWIPNQNVSRDLLLALHSRGRFILWNTQTHIQLWRVSVSEAISSWSLDPYNFKNILLYGTQQMCLSKNFSLASPFTTDGEPIDVLELFSPQSTKSASSSLKGSFLTKNSRFNPGELLTSAVHGNTVSASEFSTDLRNLCECLQVCHHGYRKECIILLFRRKFVLYSVRIMTPLVTVLLERSTSSFIRIYSCQQRDVFFCLHENGSLSVYARHGLACSVKASPTVGRAIPVLRPDPVESVGDLYHYELVAFTEGSRSLRLSGPIRLSVDQSREVSAAVTSTEGRIKFFELRTVPLQNDDEATRLSRDPLWTLSDLLPHEPGLVRPPKLYLRMHSIYTASKTDPTVCRVCPQHLIAAVANRLGCQSLVAVGNAHGGVQVWDLHSNVLWREYQFLPVPVLGIEWLHVPEQPSNSFTREIPASNSGTADSFHLGFIVYGWQPASKSTGMMGLGNASPAASASNNQNSNNPTDRSGPSSENRLEGRNHVLLVDLNTGYTYSIRGPGQAGLAEVPVRSGGLGSGTPAHRNHGDATSQTALEGPVELARVSHSGQHIAFLIGGQSVEFWRLEDFTLVTRIPFTADMQVVTLDWYQTNTRPRDLHTPLSLTYPTSLQLQDTSGEPALETPVVVPDRVGTRGYSSQRESLIMCTSQGTLRLVVVYGSEVDSTVISNAILQGLPVVSMERITAVAWFTDLIAFGTADGFVALRDLHSKKTIVRLNSGGGWGFGVGLDANTISSTEGPADLAVKALSAASLHSTGVRRLAFLPGPTAYTRLLVVLHDSLFVWQPRDMILICMARFGEKLQRCLISADWACPISGPSDPVFCLILGGDGALRLAQTGDSGSEMTILTPTNSTGNSIPNAEHPITKFFGSSAIPDGLDSRDHVLVPSLLSMKTAMIIRHLLQHQPWRRSNSPGDLETVVGGTVTDSVTEGIETVAKDENISVPANRDTANEHDYLLVCPPLSSGFAKTQLVVNSFFNSLDQRSEWSRAFCSPTATIAERCLWTAQLFGDTYEARFWRMVLHRLTPYDSPIRWRFALDLSWDLLAESGLFRRAMLAWVLLLEQRRSSPAQSKQCIRFLMLLGEHEKAVNLLLETRPDCPMYNLNMYKACLLAANASGRLRPSTELSSLQVAEDTYLSTVKLVATNLLSSGQLDEGIELLCLIGLYADACRYLESFDQWDRSIWLAKCMLSDGECDRVLRRWVKHLASSQVNRKDFALLLNVYLCDHDAALKLLVSMNQYQLAARYLEACFQAKVLKWTEESDSLYRSIFFEFSKILAKLGHRQSATYYCSLAGNSTQK